MELRSSSYDHARSVFVWPVYSWKTMVCPSREFQNSYLLSAENVYTVREVYVWPGFRMVDGKLG
jgi:hypothetical protein